MSVNNMDCLICGTRLEKIYRKSFKGAFTLYTYKCPRCDKYWRVCKEIKHKVKVGC